MLGFKLPPCAARQGAAEDDERACGAAALVSLWDAGEDAGALRVGAVYAVAGLQPRAAARRGLELNANSSVVWQPVTDLGDRRALARALPVPA